MWLLFFLLAIGMRTCQLTIAAKARRLFLIFPLFRHWNHHTWMLRVLWCKFRNWSFSSIVNLISILSHIKCSIVNIASLCLSTHKMWLSIRDHPLNNWGVTWHSANPRSFQSFIPISWWGTLKVVKRFHLV